MTRRRLLVLLLVAATARVMLLGWDSGVFPHPDERRVAQAALEIDGWFDDPGCYAYGSLHFQAVRMITTVLPVAPGLASLIVGGRVLSLLASCLALVLGCFLAREAWGRRAAEVFLLLAVLVPLDLQQSHFGTGEAHHALWVVATLAASFQLVRRPGLAWAVLTGAFLGASLAIKVSSLPMVLPVAAACVMASRGAGWTNAVRWSAAAVLGATVATWVGQPSAFTGSAPPLVYADTPAFWYPLRELGAWGLGPGLLLAVPAAAVAGLRLVVTRRRRRWNDATVLIVLLLLWVVPMSVRLAALEVELLGTWQPLVVPTILLASWALSRLPRRRWRRPVTAVVAGTTALLGACYLSGFSDPHPHRTATEWLDLVVGDDDTVAFEDRDEVLDLGSAGTAPETVLLPGSGPPTGRPAAAEWMDDLAHSDWVVLTSNRVRRAVLGPPATFGETAHLRRMLFSGEAGFQPLTRADRAPHFLGLELPVQWADESSVNYEFPRLVIFRRVEKIDAVELGRRALSAETVNPAPRWADLEREVVETLPAIEPVPDGRRQLRDALVWTALLLALGAAAWVLILPAVRNAPDAGLGLALATGWVVPAWILWFGSELDLWPVGAATATVIVLTAVFAATLAASRRRELIATVLCERRGGMILVVAATVTVGGFFLALRALNPAIAGGEKPMDFSFLNAFVHADAWPTGEPWMAGRPLHYYYFGEVLTAFPILVSGCRTAVGYNLAAATVPAVAAALLTAFGLIVARGRRGRALLLPLLALGSGSLAWPWLLVRAQHIRLFDLWWATSRVIPSPYAIEEFPLWTAVFADLHGHFIAFPVLLGALLWGWTAVRLERGRWLAATSFCGLFAGVLAATNPWDLLVFTAALGLGALAAAPRPVDALLRLSAAAGVSVVAAAPFLAELGIGIRAGAGGGLFLTTADFAPWWAVALHFGLFLGPLTALAAAGAGRLVWPAAAAGGLGAVLAVRMGSSAAALALGCTALFAAALVRTTDLGRRLGWSLALIGALLVAACERLTLIDRMNTVFKVYNGAWLVLALALGLLFTVETGRRRRLLLAVWLPLQVIAVGNVALGVAQAVFDPLVSSPRPTLDGRAYLRRDQAETWFLVRTLEAVALPNDPVAEAAGEGYSRAARIAMHTGRPTVVGWPWHLEQRGQSSDEIAARREALAELFRSDDPTSRRAILDRYGIRWIVLGDLERRTYHLRDPDPLAGIPGVTPIAGRGRARVYLVRPDDRTS